MKDTNPIIFIREAFNWSQVRTAKAFNVNQATISRWEREGVPKHGPASKISEGLLKRARRKIETPKEGV